MEGRAGHDSDLEDRLRRGDPRAFEELVIAYQHRVFGVALRMLRNRGEAEEIAQEVFLRVHRAVGDFRGEAKLSTWLYAITSRLCLNRLASGERRMAREGEESLERLRADADPAAHAERGELEAALQRAITELPEERRVVVVLRDFEGLSYEEIAAALDLPLEAAAVVVVGLIVVSLFKTTPELGQAPRVEAPSPAVTESPQERGAPAPGEVKSAPARAPGAQREERAANLADAEPDAARPSDLAKAASRQAQAPATPAPPKAERGGGAAQPARDAAKKSA